jgi:hypothetical protein
MANVKFGSTRTFWFSKEAQEEAPATETTELIPADDLVFSVRIQMPTALDLSITEEHHLNLLRNGIKDWTGIVDENGDKLVNNEDTRGMVFDLLLRYPELFDKIVKAFTSINQKN